MSSNLESDLIKKRYEKRKENNASRKYNPLLPSVYAPHQELERVLIRNILAPKVGNLQDKKVIEIGCGNGANLFNLIKLGFSPSNVTGMDLLEDRVEIAKQNLPASVELFQADATTLEYENKFDVVYVSTVFSSILDADAQKKLADTIWMMLKPGGGVIWYDFIYDNPSNKDVKGVKINQVRELFSAGKFYYWRVTLAPPISRLVTKAHPFLYNMFNLFPFLRTHVVTWIQKG